MSVSVLVVDDHAVFAETLGAALRGVPEIDVVEVATSGADAVTRAGDMTPDVALVDMLLPDGTGVEVARRLAEVSPDTRVVILTASQDIAHYTEAMAAGVSGYLTKQAAFPEVAAAIAAAHEGRVVVPSSVMERLLPATAPGKGMGADLTPRELDVLALLGRGYDAKRAATTLGISWHTCRSYIKNVLYKLDAHSSLEAVRTATRLGILTPEVAGS
jgi:DNA-binding NarL/FixJ family response regulator